LSSVTVALGVGVFFSVPALVAYSSLKIARRSTQPFTMSLSDGSTIASRDFRGRVAVLAFWSTWCLPCVSELPELQVVYTRFAHNPQVVFLAVDANWDGETPEKARAFLARRRLTLPWSFDSGGAAQALGVDSLPTIIILDREGNVAMTHFGYDASERLNEHLSDRIEQLLNRPAVAR
jgi:thiol-disulfide isomerase/thioredoxin